MPETADPILHVADSGELEHPVKGERVYLRFEGTYHATCLVMCPLCGVTVEVPKGGKGYRFPWHDGDRWFKVHPEDFVYEEDE